MEFIAKDPILYHPEGTLQNLRKLLNLDETGAMDEAIDILDQWIKKQNHFLKKDFSRDYLERTIITSKGSVERAKLRMDKSCTLRTLMPQFYEGFNNRTDLENYLSGMIFVPLPKLTEDYYRVCYVRLSPSPTQQALLNNYKYIVVVWEYMKEHDYLNGVICISDLRKVNIMDMVKNMSLNDLRQICTLIIEGLGLRLKGLHLLTPSTTIDVLVTILKQVLSPKIGKRIMVHKTEESLQEYISKDILPVECGGQERSYETLSNEWLDVLSSEQHMKYMKEVKGFVTDEKFRQSDEFNNQYMGMPGTFRSLRVD